MFDCVFVFWEKREELVLRWQGGLGCVNEGEAEEDRAEEGYTDTKTKILRQWANQHG